jgi:hypothetical protein
MNQVVYPVIGVVVLLARNSQRIILKAVVVSINATDQYDAPVLGPINPPLNPANCA